MKKIVFTSPFQEFGHSVEAGIEFKRGEPTDVTDEDAERLLAKHENRFLEGDDAFVEEMRAKYPRYRPTPNPLYGQQKHPFFELYVEPAVAKAAAPVAASSNDDH